MSLDVVSQWRSHGGTQYVLRHASEETGTPMTFALFMPDHAPGERLPLLWFLSGLTCSHANVTEKGEFRAACAADGIAFIAPDTSPRGDDVPDVDDWSFGKGAGFYVDATEQPWTASYRMRSYVEHELPTLVGGEFALDMARQGIMGHSMGGHGALTIALRDPRRFRSVSAMAPIVSPMQCPWGERALGGYLGPNPDAWRQYDACALIADGARLPDLLVDQGTADDFLAQQLRTPLLVEACEAAGQRATIRMQPGYDHSYYFISSFMAEHVAWHANRLRA